MTLSPHSPRFPIHPANTPVVELELNEVVSGYEWCSFDFPGPWIKTRPSSL